MPRRKGIDPRNIEVIDDMMADIWRRKTGAERLKIADGIYRFARDLAMSGIRNLHPDWDESAVRTEFARRMTNA